MNCLRLLCKICGSHGILPKSLGVQAVYDPTKDSLYYGGFGSVWKGVSDGQEVAVKVIRLYQSKDQEKVRRVGGRQPSLSVARVGKLTVILTDVLQGGCDVECTSPSKCAAAARSDYY